MNRALLSFIVCGVLAAAILPRAWHLDAFRAPDEDRWMTRTAEFVADAAYGDFLNFVKSSTPGITTQWLGAPAIRFDDWATRKASLVVAQAALLFILVYLLYRLWGLPTAIIAALLLALNPLLIAHTRIYGTDSLLALFFGISIITLLLWKKELATRYLIFAAAAAALAALSKITAGILVPVSLGVIVWHTRSWRPLFYWLASYIITALVVLPALALDPRVTLENIFAAYLASSAGYTDLHTAPWHYYLTTLFFFTTPFQIIGIIFLPIVWKKFTLAQIRQILLLAGLTLLFTVGLSLGAKKGDRYLLPVFLLLDLIAARSLTTGFLSTFSEQKARLFTRPALLGSAAFFIVWQIISLWHLHPHYLAYSNPLTKPWLGERRLGWGEGLDLAAEYLNQKPEAQRLKAAAYYPVEFSYRFKGEAVPAHQHEEASIDYVVLYRAMLQRGPNAWETDVLHQYKNQTPEKIIRLNGIDYVWIYSKT